MYIWVPQCRNMVAAVSWRWDSKNRIQGLVSWAWPPIDDLNVTSETIGTAFVVMFMVKSLLNLMICITGSKIVLGMFIDSIQTWKNRNIVQILRGPRRTLESKGDIKAAVFQSTLTVSRLWHCLDCAARIIESTCSNIHLWRSGSEFELNKAVAKLFVTAIYSSTQNRCQP